MPASWVTRHQGLGGTTAFGTEKDAVEQYLLYLDGRHRADLFRVSHDGDIGAFDVRQRIEGAIFMLPSDVPTGMTVSVDGIVIQHVLSSEG